MLKNFKRAAIVLLSAIMLTATASAQDDVFSIPTGTSENPLLDVKYRFDMEPYIFTGLSSNILAFHTYLCSTATYADESVVETREWTGNYPAINVGYFLGVDCTGSQSEITPAEWADPVFYEDEKLWVYGVSVAPECLYDLSNDLYLYVNPYTALYNLNSCKEVIFPTNSYGTFSHDDITYVEYEDQSLDEIYGFDNPDYSLYRSWNGRKIYQFPIVEPALVYLAEAELEVFNLTAVINDDNHTVVSCSPIEFKNYEITLTSLGTQYGYMDSIKMQTTLELKYEDTSYRFQGESISHIAYPTTEEAKAAAREAGYNVP